MFVKATNGTVDQYPYTVGDLRRDNPNTSFPKNVPEITMAVYNMFPVGYEAAPSFDPMTHYVEHSDAPVLKDGSWVLTKTVVPLSDEQIAFRNESVASQHRTTRNKLLADSDWTQMNDSPLANEAKTAWATYRQSLRDITADESWPNVTFPTAP